MVAFDLEETASQGSQAFIQDFIIPTIINNTRASVTGHKHTEKYKAGKMILSHISSQYLLILLYLKTQD